MGDIVTGVQQIMLGTVTKNEKEAAETLRRIKAAGYDGIELNSFMIHDTSLMVRMMTKAAGMPVGKGGKLNWKKLIEDADLQVISLHTDLGSLKRDPEAVAAEAESFHTKYVVITGMYRFDYSDEESLKSLCEDLNSCGQKLSEHGMELLYHNHNCEWRRINGNGQPAYDYILEHTEPKYVNFEYDSYWPTEAGVNVPKVMQKLGSRQKLWHVTDRGTRVSGPSMTPILKSDSVELGCGNMDFDTLTAIAKENGVTGIVLETHRNWIDKDPLKSIEVSGKYLQNVMLA